MDNKTITFNFLQKLGLTPREVTIYLAGLKIGHAPASAIAKEAAVSRPLAYQAIEELMQKGLVSKVQATQGAQFTMASPDQLGAVIQGKEHELRALKQELPSVFAELTSLTPHIHKQSGVRFYEGKEAVKKVAWEVLETKEKKIRSLTPLKSILDTIDSSFMRQWMKERNKRKIESNSIWSAHHTEVDFQSPYRKLRLAPKDMEFTSTILIYDNTVVIIAPPPAVFSMVVESEHFSSTMKAVFDQIWTISSEI